MRLGNLKLKSRFKNQIKHHGMIFWVNNSKIVYFLNNTKLITRENSVYNIFSSYSSIKYTQIHKFAMDPFLFIWKLSHKLHCIRKWNFPLRVSLVNVTKSAGNCGLITFTGEILNGKFHFLCSATCSFQKEQNLRSLPKLSGYLKEILETILYMIYFLWS